MIASDHAHHWETVYSTHAETNLSWYQERPQLSLELIREVAPAEGGRIIDVGGGASLLVDELLLTSFEEITVLDISETALIKAKARLGERANRIRWIVADVTEDPTIGSIDVWHDRAVFHFLTDAADRKSYVELARKTIASGGHLIIATFADDGPKHCSNLDVCRYNAHSLASELSDGFVPVREVRETHTTPWGTTQAFLYGVFARL